jgi:hypothetical protein
MQSKLKLRASTVIASIALFVALGGTSYAIGNKISGSQLKNRSIPGQKLKNHTVTGTQVNVSQFPTVPSAHNADDATNATTATNASTAGTITGTITGGQVSSAVANATNATDATNATTATNATNLAGHTFAQVNTTSGSATDVTILNDLGGLTLALRCTGGQVNIDARTATNDAGYAMSAVANANATNLTGKEGDFMIGQTVTDTTAAPAAETFAYQPSSTEVVSGTLISYDNAGTCSVYGNVQESS